MFLDLTMSRKGVGCRERPQLQLLYPQDPTAPAAPPASQLLVLEESGSQIQPDDGCFISFSQGPQFQGVQSGQSMGQEGGSVTEETLGGGQAGIPACSLDHSYIPHPSLSSPGSRLALWNPGSQPGWCVWESLFSARLVCVWGAPLVLELSARPKGACKEEHVTHLTAVHGSVLPKVPSLHYFLRS